MNTSFIQIKEAEHWRELPEIINTSKMKQAMAVLERFSEKERDYHLYQVRQNVIREEQTRQKLLKEAVRNKEEALRREEEERKLKEVASPENMRYSAWNAIANSNGCLTTGSSPFSRGQVLSAYKLKGESSRARRPLLRFLPVAP